jgi:hypothetical protein
VASCRGLGEERAEHASGSRAGNHMASVFARHTRSLSEQDSETLRLMARVCVADLWTLFQKLKRARCYLKAKRATNLKMLWLGTRLSLTVLSTQLVSHTLPPSPRPFDLRHEELNAGLRRRHRRIHTPQ